MHGRVGSLHGIGNGRPINLYSRKMLVIPTLKAWTMRGYWKDFPHGPLENPKQNYKQLLNYTIYIPYFFIFFCWHKFSTEKE